MVTCQSANQLKTPAKVSWALKMVSQFGSLGYTIMGKMLIWQLSRRQSLTPFTRRVSTNIRCQRSWLFTECCNPSMFTESWVEGKSVEEKDAQPTERTAALWGLSSKSIQEFGWTSQGMDWGWVKAIKRATTHKRVKEFWLKLFVFLCY